MKQNSQGLCHYKPWPSINVCLILDKCVYTLGYFLLPEKLQ